MQRYISFIAVFVMAFSMALSAENYYSWNLARKYTYQGKPAEEVVTFAIGDTNDKNISPAAPPSGDYIALYDGDNTYNSVTKKVSSADEFYCVWNLKVQSDGDAMELALEANDSTNTFPAGDSATLILSGVGDADSAIQVNLLASTSFKLELSAGVHHFQIVARSVPLATGVTLDYTLAAGWNLIGIPFYHVEKADTLFSTCQVRDPGNHNRIINSPSQLKSGCAYWVYNPADTEKSVTLTGTAFAAGEPALPELTSRWSWTAVVGCYEKGWATSSVAPIATTWTWNPTAKIFQPQTGNLKNGIGYMVPN